MLSDLLAGPGDPVQTRGDWAFFPLNSWWASRKTKAGPVVGPETSMKLSTYYACIRNMGEDIGGLPWDLVRRGSGKREEIEEHWFLDLMDQPNKYMGGDRFREIGEQHRLGWGNFYAEIERRADGRPVALHALHPAFVKVRRPEGVNDDIEYEVRYPDNPGLAVVLSRESVFHVANFGGDDYGGWSMAQLADESIGGALAAQGASNSFFGSGVRPSGVLSTPNTLKADAMAKLRKAYEDMHSGPDNAGRMMILDGDMKWQQLTINPNDAQFLETRQFQVEEICRWFRMPPHMVQHLLRATFSNIEHQEIEYVKYTLTPGVRRWERECDRKLLKPHEPKLRAKMNMSAMVRGDMAARSEFYTKIFSVGGITPNEIRANEDLPPVEDGDTVFVGAQTVPIERAIAGETKLDGNAEPPSIDEPDEEDAAQAAAVRRLVIGQGKRIAARVAKQAKAKAKAGKIAEYVAEQLRGPEPVDDAIVDLADAYSTEPETAVNAACDSLAMCVEGLFRDADKAETAEALLVAEWPLRFARAIGLEGIGCELN